ncbi:MAG: thioredoxin domain-containing protein [Deltaproteobacteria bacterium]|nr:thioredoxin domain-containing protein [Deltaproteobacteria bacterium]
MPEASPVNRLARETSPYLRQHAHNPVDWRPWGPEALEAARREDKPIFLSVGYSTCHWCHVMAHECFENPQIAALMNQHFVNIKVDREERPDLDETYMTAVQLLTGRGGWPMSVFLTPDLKPFYAGTYFPPEDRGGLPGFPRLLAALAQAYRQNREPLLGLTRQVEERLIALATITPSEADPDQTAVTQAAARLQEDFDQVNGGFGGAPKFPRGLELGFLLLHHHAQGDPRALEMVRFSLERMARGGIYDQAGGGFHRYTVDAQWIVPHFEKMLYDNALLVPLYLALYQMEGLDWSRTVAVETLDFVLRELTAPEGGFYAAWDADSEGEEGKFYLWTLREFTEVVGPQDAALAAAALGVSQQGNFEGKNILTRPGSLEELAGRLNLAPEEASRRLAEARARLFQARARRVPPHRDEKIITSWNGLMISALALGAQALGEARYAEAAARAARFLLGELHRDGRLHRIHSQGQVSVPGFLDDYAFLANACLDLFETDFEPAWLAAARRLAEAMEDLFLDPDDGAYFYVARDQEAVLVRRKNLTDGAIPSGNSMAARTLLRLHRFTEKGRFGERAQAILRRLVPPAQSQPWGFGHYWSAAVLSLTPPVDLTLVGPAAHPALVEMVRAAHRAYLPERRLVRKDPADCARLEELCPPARHYSLLDEKPAAYLCHSFTCRPPINDPEELARQLAELQRGR